MRTKGAALAKKRKARMKETTTTTTTTPTPPVITTATEPTTPPPPPPPPPPKTGWDALSSTQKIITIAIPLIIALISIDYGYLNWFRFIICSF